MKTVLRQGESIELDYPIESDTIPTDMEGSWKIMQQGVMINSGVMVKTGDNLRFQLRILDTDTVDLEGKYVLYVAVTTPTTNQNGYIHVEELVFKKVI